MAETTFPQCDAPNRPFMAAMKTGTKVVILYRPRCGCWKCPACAEFNKWQWGKRATYGALALLDNGTPLSFLTLTSHPRAWSAAKTLEIFQKAWPSLRKRATRAGGKFEYFIVPEKHENGRLHLHGIVSVALPVRFWKDSAASVGLGYQADARPVADAYDVARYTTKHLQKQLETQGWPPNFRRVRRSRNWPKEPPQEPRAGWEYEVFLGERNAEKARTQMVLDGYTIIEASGGNAWEVQACIDQVTQI